MSDCHITVYVPGLLGPQPALSQLPTRELPDLSLLERALSRAVVATDQIDNAYAGIFQLFGIQPDASGDYPAAAICQSVQQLQLDDFCLRFDPVYLQADMNSAVLRAHHELRLDETEAQQLIASINQHLQEDGLQLVMGQPHHWYLSITTSRDLQTSPLPTLLYQDINPHLPRGEQAGKWRRLMNEIQMLLYDHPVNLQREQQGQLTVNSLWLWGGGTLPAKGSVTWQRVYTDDGLFDAVARFHDIAADDLPESVERLLQDCQGQVLLSMDDCIEPLRNNDLFGWLDAVQQFQSQWLNPLLQALQQNRYHSLTLLPANGRRYVLTPKSLRRWWKRRRHFARWVADE